MKIGFFTMSYPPVPDGIATYVKSMEDELNRRGHEVFVFTTGKHISFKPLRRGNVFTFPSKKMFFYPQYRMPAFPFISTARLVKKLGIELIHIHTPFILGTCGLAAARKEKIPVVSTMHTLFVDMVGSVNIPFQEPLYRLGWRYAMGLYTRCDVVTVPTPSMKRRFEKENKRHPCTVEVVPNGIPWYEKPSKRNPKFRKAEKTVGYIGRVTKDKGIEHLMKAVEKLPLKDVKLLVAGMGPYLDVLIKIKEKQGLKRTEFLGYLKEEDKRTFLASLDASVLPSRADTFGIVLLEAMREGTPVIGAAAGGIPDVIENEKNGLLFPYGDIDSLTEALMKVLEDEKLSKKLAKEGRTTVEKRFSLGASADKLESIYSALIKGRMEKKRKTTNE